MWSPASCQACSVQPTCAIAPRTSGTSPIHTNSSPGSPSGRPAKCHAVRSWSHPSTDTPKRRVAGSSACICARWSTETSTSGGSSDTDVNALAVIAWTSPSRSVVTTVTPVEKRPSAERKRRGSIITA